MEIEFRNIEKRYGGFCAVENLNLKIKSGALHFLLGPSGCGKTTSLRMLAGLEKPTAGQILMGGKDVTHASAQERGIGMVFQNYALWPHMTVRKNIEYGLTLRKLPEAERKRRLDEVLSITQLDRFVERLPGQLSGGQQQRVALARALAVRPNALLLDEPLSNLDAKLRLEMRENICRIHAETGITTLYVTHDQKEALSMGTGVSVMYAGKLMQTDTPRGMYNRPQNAFIAGFIGEANLIEGEVKSLQGTTAEVKTALGIIKGNLGVKLGVGSACLAMLRPEAFKVDFAGVGLSTENQIPATLVGDTYLGECEQFLFEAAGGLPIRVTVFHSPEHGKSRGDQVLCGIAQDDVLILGPAEHFGQGT